MATSDIVITASKIDVTGGHVGEETTIFATITINAEASSFIQGKINGVAVSFFGFAWLIDPGWAILKRDKSEGHATNYPGYLEAHVKKIWTYNIELTFIPETIGKHRISYRGYTDFAWYDYPEGVNWPPKPIEPEYTAKYFFDTIEILPAEAGKGEFMVVIGGQPRIYNFDGLILGEEVNQTNGDVTVKIPANTMILGTDELVVNAVGTVLEPQNAEFSNPVEILVEGQTVTFTEIVDGVPQ